MSTFKPRALWRYCRWLAASLSFFGGGRGVGVAVDIFFPSLVVFLCGFVVAFCLLIVSVGVDVSLVRYCRYC